MARFINLSNHPSDKQSDNQLAAAREYGEILDLPFPNVLPEATTEEIKKLAEPIIRQILEEKPAAVMCQGEFSLSVYVISQLMQKGILVLTSCSARDVIETKVDGEYKKTATFRFVQFRPYVL